MKIAASVLIASLALAPCLAGCGANKKGFGGAENSFVRKQQSVSIEFVHSGGSKSQVDYAMDQDDQKLAGAALAAEGIALLAGFAVDQVQQEIQVESERYQASFATKAALADFYSFSASPTYDTNIDKISGQLTQDYDQLILRREAYFGDAQKTAMQIVCSLKPAESDPRLVVVSVETIEVLATRAKLINDDATFSVDLALDFETTRINDEGKLASEAVASLKWNESGLRIKSGNQLSSPQTVGVIAVPVHSTLEPLFVPIFDVREDPNGVRNTRQDAIDNLKLTGKSLGFLMVTAKLTETDESRAATIFKDAAKLIGDFRPKVVEAAKNVVAEEE
ncbi:MAG: hypothetical protein AAF916_00055 [Planctomycetota bacterium]